MISLKSIILEGVNKQEVVDRVLPLIVKNLGRAKEVRQRLSFILIFMLDLVATNRLLERQTLMLNMIGIKIRYTCIRLEWLVKKQ